MVEMYDIEQVTPNKVYMKCHVIDQSIEKPDFDILFNPRTMQIYSDLTGISEYYAKHAVAHIYMTVVLNKETLPKKSVAVWY